jgi:hypothetical protein
MGARLNHGRDAEFAARRIGQLGLSLRQRAGSLSGGQRPGSPSPADLVVRRRARQLTPV